jgi:hypothetical protein
MHLSLWNGLITKLTFRFMLLKRAYTTQEFGKILESVDFSKSELRVDDIGMEARFEK